MKKILLAAGILVVTSIVCMGSGKVLVADVTATEMISDSYGGVTMTIASDGSVITFYNNNDYDVSARYSYVWKNLLTGKSYVETLTSKLSRKDSGIICYAARGSREYTGIIVQSVTRID